VAPSSRIRYMQWEMLAQADRHQASLLGAVRRNWLSQHQQAFMIDLMHLSAEHGRVSPSHRRDWFTSFSMYTTRQSIQCRPTGYRG
jgi:hypothetical protein